MQKMLTAGMVSILAAGMVSTAAAQDAPAAHPSKPASSQSASPKPKTTAKKPGTTTSKAAPAYTLKTDKDKSSYALGMSIGTGLHRQGIPVDPAVVARGLKDAMSGSKTLMTEEEMKSTLQQLRAEVGKEQAAKAHVAGEGNRKEGEAFLSANKSKEGVTALPDGLQYKIVKEGTGPEANRQRYGDRQLPWDAGEWERIRQLLQARPARLLSSERRHQGLDRGLAVDAGRIQVGVVYSSGPRLWRQSTRPKHWPRGHIDL